MKRTDYRHWYEDARYGSRTPQRVRMCEVEGCPEAGEYKAPKQRAAQGVLGESPAREFHWFCLEHVSEYNKAWDYFRDMPPEEVAKFQRESVTGHRPTWRMGIKASSAQAQLEEKLHAFMRGEEAPMAVPPPVFRLKPKYRKALAVLGMEWPITAESLKKRFKALVKETHPDLHPDDAEAEARFKEITSAHQLLQKGLQAADLD